MALRNCHTFHTSLRMLTVLHIQNVLLTAAQWDNYEEMHFPINGAPPHLQLSVHAWLDSHFTGRWTGRRGPTVWPPRNPHLNTCDLFLWGCAKPRSKQRLQNELKQRQQQRAFRRCFSLLITSSGLFVFQVAEACANFWGLN